MTKYCELIDIEDDSLNAEQSHLTRAEIWLDTELINRGYVLDEISLPNSLLSQLAILKTMVYACVSQASNEKYTAKAEKYQAQIDELLKGLDAYLKNTNPGLTAGGSVTVALV